LNLGEICTLSTLTMKHKFSLA